MARRKKTAKRGFGTIRTVAPDKHVLRWREHTGSESVRRCETVHGTLEEAEARMREIEVLANAETRCSTTLDAFWRSMYWPDAQRSLAPSTQRGYRDIYESYIKPTFGDVPMDGISGLEVQRWLLAMPYGAARHARSVLSAVYSRAVAWDVATINPMVRRYRLPDRSTIVKPQNKIVASLDELAAVADACHGEPWEGAFLLSAFGGARRSEAFGVRADEIEEAFIDGVTVAFAPILRGVQLIDNAVTVTPTKTAGSVRTVVVTEPWSLRLLELAEDALAAGNLYLCGDMEEPPNPNTMAAAYKRWFTGQPLRYVPWKNLRNSYATYVHAAGVELPTVAKLLGHTRQQTTYTHYDRPTAEQLGKIVSDALPSVTRAHVAE